MSILIKLATVLLLISALLSCTSTKHITAITKDQATIEYELLYSMPKETISFHDQVKPILENRCIVCHSCYDAPCQLKLSSPAGILRGSNDNKVYNGTRITAGEPTRLFIDAMTTGEWRKKGFRTVLNEGDDNPARNLEDSVIYNMLRLKQLHPQAHTGMLSGKFDLSLTREQFCATNETFDQYAAKHPEGGMPYALPNLRRDEYTTLVHWLAQGAPMPEEDLPSQQAAKQIGQWEIFLNGNSNKEKLVARYIYEHLFHAHLHLENTDDREFYRLVRSSTAPGTAINVIPTRRPYGKPPTKFYYRIVRHQGSIAAKNHLVYELSNARMQRYTELFITPDYKVAELPSYDPVVASNPIKSFEDLPLKSRYQFLLDESRFFIEGFIKGPVCRGQLALNVIEDQFWVVFVDPDAPILTTNPDFLKAIAGYLASPAELEDNLRLLAVGIHYKDLLKKYNEVRTKAVKKFETVTLDAAMKYIWNGASQGNKKSRNAALTIFRHFDSASVNFGLIGDYPETAWVIDYPVLERIHYLLVAGFDVYGNIGHQLNTRLYMDFLRMEAEDKFLALLPANKRKQIRDSWYSGIRASDHNDDEADSWIGLEFVSGYQTENPQLELYKKLEDYLGDLAGDGDYINRCQSEGCKPNVNSNVLRVDSVMQKVARMDGPIVQYLPDVAFLRVRMGAKPEQDLAYTMISNKAYKNVTSMFAEVTMVSRRDYEHDTQTVVRWLEGAYPNFFYDVSLGEVETFVERYNAIHNRDDYERFVAIYGVRRTNEKFWELSDWFNAESRRQQPRLSGIFDLSRYQNR